MTKAIFTFSESSQYDDQPEIRYQFPKTYLAQAKRAEGDWILYYEPRRTTGPFSATGRSSYFAAAMLDRVVPDAGRPDHFIGRVSHYIEFDRAVPFNEDGRYYESALSKPDGSTNKGAFGRSVRPIPDAEFEAIVRAGFARSLDEWEVPLGVAQTVPAYVVRPIISEIVSRKFRDEAFRRHVRLAYSNTCAISGLRILNGGGRPEVQAAHIRPVEADGPDTVRNGLALTGTIHWLFDRGLVTIDNSFNVLISPHGVPDDLARFIRPDRKILLPVHPECRPHATYLAWHRDHRFKMS